MATLDDVPEVELEACFESDTFVGPPPTWSASIEKPQLQSDLSKSKYSRSVAMRESYEQQRDQIFELPINLSPIIYTPVHPSMMPQFRRPIRKAGSSIVGLSSTLNIPPNPSAFAPAPTVRISLPGPAPGAPNFRHVGPVNKYARTVEPRLAFQAQPAPAHQYNPRAIVQQPRFGSAPRFDTDIRPQAPPVRTAYEDFIRHIQTLIPSASMSELVNQINTTPQQVRLPVPNGMTPQAMQRLIQESLMRLNGHFPQPPISASPNRPAYNSNHVPSYLHNFPNIQVPQLSAGQMSLLRHSTPSQGVHPAHVATQPAPAQQPPPPNEDDMAKQDKDADADEDDEYEEVETYSDYHPAKLDFGKPHPDPVVETSSLSTVEPPDIQYQLNLPRKIIDNALLSALQLEAIIYACQQHSHYLPDNRTRRGFLIGDGAGVGKGRTIAGIIYENYLCGRKKSLWFSVSSDLMLDAVRDLKDIGASRIPVQHLKAFSYGRRINLDAGVIFTTYSGLISKSQSVRGSLGTRIGQIQNWLGKNFDGVIVFDECHKAKNISVGKAKKQTKAAECVVEIQNLLPQARVVYASATGASETRHLGYMTRLGIWGEGTPYASFCEFCDAIERRGVGAMELVAVDLKTRGSYIARQLSFKTTSFEIRVARLTDEFIRLYDSCVEMWSRALRLFEEAAGYMTDKKRARTIWAVFWAAHQKFFKYLCICSKVPVVVEIAKKALADGKCVVIGLQSTGESKTNEALEDGDINEFVSTARATFESLIDHHFPAPRRGRPMLSVPGFSSSKSPSASSSSIVDENWLSEEVVKFVVNDGRILPQVDNEKCRRAIKQNYTKREPTKIETALQELADQKRAKKPPKKSDRTIRAKRRSARQPKRVQRIEPDSDSDSSSLFSSLSEEPLEYDSDDTFVVSGPEEETTENNIAPDLTAHSSTSSSNDVKFNLDRLPIRNNVLDSDSDSDIQITAVKPAIISRPRKNFETIFISDDDDDDSNESPRVGNDDPMVRHAARLLAMRDELHSMIDRIGPNLPCNTLDDLIDQLGGPAKVAEMTGRKGRIVKDDDGEIKYRQRNEADSLDDMNVAEKERFMRGEKLVAIISEAASSGISLQADRRVKNKRRRVHITIELPWSADRAIQQFGRTHRSNQLSGPEYVFVISELSGEQRFASIVAKRLECLGALTHGDRKATTESRDLSQYNIASRFCAPALECLYSYIRTGRPFAGIEPDYSHGNFIKDAQEALLGVGVGCEERSEFAYQKEDLKLDRFLNRLLGMKVHIQNSLFKLFTEYTNRIITRKKIQGSYDAGILELNSASGKASCEAPENFFLRTNSETLKCTLHRVKVERGIAWAEALQLLKEATEDDRNGFYVSVNPLSGAELPSLYLRESGVKDVNQFRVFKPNTGRSPKTENFFELPGSKQDIARVERIWKKVYDLTDKRCVHLCYFNSCKRVEANIPCDIGSRQRNYCILSGAILTALPYLERKVPAATAKLQVVRLKLDAVNRVIGPNIRLEYLNKVRQQLRTAENGLDFEPLSRTK